MAPENTRSSFQIANQIALPWIECDVRIIGDGTLVIFHDTTLDRCTDHTGSLLQLNRKDLKDIDAGSWFSPEYYLERILTLKQFILYIKNTQLSVNLEIKTNLDNNLNILLLENLLKTLNDSWKAEQNLIISSSNFSILEKIKKNLPEIPIACVLTSEMLKHNCLDATKKTGATYMHLSQKNLTRQTINLIKNQGYKVNVWTVNNTQIARKLHRWGVEGIFTDIPQKFPENYPND